MNASIQRVIAVLSRGSGAARIAAKPTREQSFVDANMINASIDSIIATMLF